MKGHAARVGHGFRQRIEDKRGGFVGHRALLGGARQTARRTRILPGTLRSIMRRWPNDARREECAASGVASAPRGLGALTLRDRVGARDALNRPAIRSAESG